MNERLYDDTNVTVSKQQAVIIMKGAIEECDDVAKERPDLARGCEALKAHLSSALDQAEHEIGDDSAVKVIGKAMVSAARNFAIPISIKSAIEVARKETEERRREQAKAEGKPEEPEKKYDPSKPDIHAGHLTAVQTSCVSLGHHILGTPMPEAAARAATPIVRMSHDELAALDATKTRKASCRLPPDEACHPDPRLSRRAGEK